ncbi:MAG: sugar phosphate isomerase/epimerase family protein [Oscillospiraceae bacterium]|jgi:sugar phosphate isomerase/epimerase
MARLITLCSGQFGDMPLEQLCSTMRDIGYDGFELACHAHIDVHKILSSADYFGDFNGTLERYDMQLGALSAHLIGQCVGDRYDPRLDQFAPARYAGKPEDIRRWAVEEMQVVAHAAKKLNLTTVTCFLGSPIWAFWYSFPQTSLQMVEEGFGQIKELWTPIFDEYDRCGVRLAFEVHPSEIAFDYYTTRRLLETLEYRPTLGLNFDPSHLLWQGVNPLIFLLDFADRIYHVHMKDVKLSKDPRAGLLGSHLEFGDLRRGWNFVSPGHGDVDFDDIIRGLNAIDYQGPLCIEWEDSGMDRIFGVTESLSFVKQLNFQASNIRFDAALKVE